MIIYRLCRYTDLDLIKLYRFVIEKRLASAAEDVATTLGGDKKKTTSDLLQKVLLYKEKSSARESEQLKDTDNIKSEERPVQFTYVYIKYIYVHDNILL